MKTILFILLGVLAMGCTSSPKRSGQVKTDSLAAVVVIVDTTFDVSFGLRPVFPKYSGRIFTDDENEATITPLLDSILDEYSHHNYFSIKTGGMMWHFDQNHSLRVVTEELKDNSYKDISIYLFANSQFVASYRDVDMRGQDNQTNKERIITSQCPTCGVSFNLVSYDTLVNVVSEGRIKELSDYYFKETIELLDWIAKAKVTKQEGRNLYFERESPYKALYTVNSELYNKFIKKRRH